MRELCLAGAVALMTAIHAVPAAGPVDPKDFALLPWGHTSGTSHTYELIRECGFNLAGFVAPEELDLVQQAGLKAIVHDSSVSLSDAAVNLDEAEITSRVQSLVNRVNSHPAVFGYYLRDEPGYPLYPGLARWNAAFDRLAPGKLAYINMLPNYIGQGHLDAWGVKTYDRFIESFVEMVKPTFISYDHYAMMDDGSLRGGYFQNLETFRTIALRHNIPFWNIVLGNAHFNYAEPSPATLAFQAFTTLAYGARGLSYFTYFAPQIGNYRLAPIDQFGNKTPTWDMMRNVNTQVQNLLPTYVKLKSVNVFHYPDVPEGCRDTTSSKHLAKVEGSHLVVGEFEDPEGVPYAMVVNKDFHRSTSFGVQFKEKGRIMMISPFTGAGQPWSGENDWLAPGQGTLLFLQR
jgi:hypothetical protein